MNKKEQAAVDVIYDFVKEMKKELRDDIKEVREKISKDISDVYTKIGDHIVGPCSVQNELTEFKEKHDEKEYKKDEYKKDKRTFLRMDISNWIAFVACLLALVIAIFK